MPLRIGVMSKKGGVGKSTASRLIAREYKVSDWDVKIADFDASQGTSAKWNTRRIENEIKPDISVEICSELNQILKQEHLYDLIIFDCPGRATRLLLDIAKISDIIIVPTCIGLDDLQETAEFSFALKQKGIPKEKIAFAMWRITGTEKEIEEAKEYILSTGFFLLPGIIREMPSYRQAMDMGKAISEIPFSGLKEETTKFIDGLEERIAVLNGDKKNAQTT